MLLELIWATLAALNILPFGTYILYQRKIAKEKPWNIFTDHDYEPTVSLVVPTYDEESVIKKKLDNIAETDYPKEKMELIVVDSASKDRTADIAEEWFKEHPNINTKLVKQDKRKGMVNALNDGLKSVHNEIFVKTDADCLLLRESLRNAVKYLADPEVGSVAGLHIIESSKETSSVRSEKTYRDIYRWLRIGESKLYSTVLYEGELMLVRKSILDKIGFDEEIGGEDVTTALRITEQGYRAITAEDAYFIEQTPYTWSEKFKQKIRRGRHVFQALWKYKYLIFRKRSVFNRLILPFEFYIYVLNPFLTVALTVVSMAFVARYPYLLLLSPLLLIRRVREMLITHLANGWIMLLAVVKEIRSREDVTWQKIEEIRK